MGQSRETVISINTSKANSKFRGYRNYRTTFLELKETFLKAELIHKPLCLSVGRPVGWLVGWSVYNMLIRRYYDKTIGEISIKNDTHTPLTYEMTDKKLKNE